MHGNKIRVITPSADIPTLRASERAGALSPEEVLLIGDSLSSDVRGGVDYGLDTCWYNPFNLPYTLAALPTHTITDLSDLRTLLSVWA